MNAKEWADERIEAGRVRGAAYRKLTGAVARRPMARRAPSSAIAVRVRCPGCGQRVQLSPSRFLYWHRRHPFIADSAHCTFSGARLTSEEAER